MQLLSALREVKAASASIKNHEETCCRMALVGDHRVRQESKSFCGGEDLADVTRSKTSRNGGLSLVTA